MSSKDHLVERREIEVADQAVQPVAEVSEQVTPDDPQAEAARRAELEQLSDEELAERYKYLPQRARNQSAAAFNLLPLGVGLLGFFLDQVVKLYTVASFVYDPNVSDKFQKRVPILGDYLGIIYRENTGGAFSLFRGIPWLFTAFSSTAILGLLFYIFRYPRRIADNTWLAISLGMILGGVGGNLTDRLRQGFVTDMINFRIPQWGFQFATFNVADSLLTVGFVILFLHLWLGGDKAKAEDRAQT